MPGPAARHKGRMRDTPQAIPTTDALRRVAPALEKYAAGPVAGLWKRPVLAPRGRSIVTLPAVIARGQGGALRPQLERALDNGVTPREASEIITHLAFYCGWPNAMAAIGPA